MLIDQSEERILLRNSFDRFVDDNYDMDRRISYRRSENGYSRKTWNLIASMGLLAAGADENHGGMGGSLADVVAIMEAAGRGVVCEPLLTVSAIAPFAISRYCPEAVCEQWLAPIVAGECRVGFVERDGLEIHHDCLAGGGFVLEGGDADLIVAIAGGRLWLIPVNDPAVTRTPYRLADGSWAARLELRGHPDTAQSFDMPDEAAELILARAELAACGEAWGLMERLFDETLDYVKTRTQFGTTIWSFQSVQHRMARARIAIDQCRSLLLASVSLFDRQGAGWASIAHAAVASVRETALPVAHECIQFHGGIGVTDELVVSHGHKRLLVLTRFFGDAADARRRYLKAGAA